MSPFFNKFRLLVAILCLVTMPATYASALCVKPDCAASSTALHKSKAECCAQEVNEGAGCCMAGKEVELSLDNQWSHEDQCDCSIDTSCPDSLKLKAISPRRVLSDLLAFVPVPATATLADPSSETTSRRVEDHLEPKVSSQIYLRNLAIRC